MRQRRSYERVHGKRSGSKLHRALQKEAVHAKWKVRYREERDLARARVQELEAEVAALKAQLGRLKTAP